MSYCPFRPARESAPPRSLIGISSAAVLDLTVEAPGTSNRAVRGALIGNSVNSPLLGLTRMMIGEPRRNCLRIMDLRGERGGFFGDTQSRADEVDNWASNKSLVPSEARRYEKRGGFGLESSNGGADAGNWGKRKEEEGRRSGGAFDSLRERRGGIEWNGVDSESWGRKREESSGGNRPRLNLQPRTLPVNEGASVVKPKGSNPFGEARPREEVLKEKEIEENLEFVKVKEDVDGHGVWSGRGRGRGKGRLQPEEKTDKSWRRPELVDPSPQSAGETERENAEDTEDKDSQI